VFFFMSSCGFLFLFSGLFFTQDKYLEVKSSRIVLLIASIQETPFHFQTNGFNLAVNPRENQMRVE